MSRYYQYGFQNWENCPFQGQLEISCAVRPSKETQFKVVGGIFFRGKETETKKEIPDDEDL